MRNVYYLVFLYVFFLCIVYVLRRKFQLNWVYSRKLLLNVVIMQSNKQDFVIFVNRAILVECSVKPHANGNFIIYYCYTVRFMNYFWERLVIDYVLLPRPHYTLGLVEHCRGYHRGRKSFSHFQH